MRRYLWLSPPAFFFMVLSIACRLVPASQGLGTHRQLGLPDCGFHALTGLPCPGCGLTTSIVYLVHGHLLHAFASHPLGPVVLALFAWASVCSLLEFNGKSTLLRALLNGKHSSWVGGSLALFMLVWVARLFQKGWSP